MGWSRHWCHLYTSEIHICLDRLLRMQILMLLGNLKGKKRRLYKIAKTRRCMCVYMYVFLSCEITSKTEMIVFTEAWVYCEIDLTMFIQMSFLFFGLIMVRFRVKLG